MYAATCRPGIIHPKPWDRISQTLAPSGACCGPVWPCLCLSGPSPGLPGGRGTASSGFSALSGACCGPVWPCLCLSGPSPGLPGGRGTASSGFSALSGACCGPVWPCLCLSGPSPGLPGGLFVPVWALSWPPWGAWHCQFWLFCPLAVGLSGPVCACLAPGGPGTASSGYLPSLGLDVGLSGLVKASLRGLHLGFLTLPMLAPLPSCHWPALFFLPSTDPRPGILQGESLSNKNLPARIVFGRRSCSESGFSTTILQRELLSWKLQAHTQGERTHARGYPVGTLSCANGKGARGKPATPGGEEASQRAERQRRSG